MTKRDAAFFVDGADADRILLVAIVAAPKEPLIPLARLSVHHLVHVYASAVNATRIVAPSKLFQ